MADTDTVIVGAGPAGLATAARLRELGVDFLVLDAGSAVGASWRGHYERLHLHTPKRHSSLPGMPMGPELPEYPSRLEVVAYLERYAAAFGIEPGFDEPVDRIERGMAAGRSGRRARPTVRTTSSSPRGTTTSLMSPPGTGCLGSGGASSTAVSTATASRSAASASSSWVRETPARRSPYVFTSTARSRSRCACAGLSTSCPRSSSAFRSRAGRSGTSRCRCRFGTPSAASFRA